MTLTLEPISVKDAFGANQAIVAYNNPTGNLNAFGYLSLDTTGAPIDPATSENQAAGNTSLAAIAANSALQATSALQTAANTLLSEIETALAGTLTVTGTVELSGTVPLPTGAATAANQATANTALAAIEAAVQSAVPAGSNTIGSVSAAANATGGTSVYPAWGGTSNAAFTNAPTPIKAGAGNLYGLAGMLNPNGATVYMQFFDLAPGSVTLGTTPPKMVVPLVQGAVYDRDFTGEEKVGFGTAITVAVTTTATGSTAPGAGVSGNIIFK